MTFVSFDGSQHDIRPVPGDHDLPRAVRYIAGLKNVSLTPGQCEGAVTWAKQCLSDPNAALLDFSDLPAGDPTSRIIDRIVDVLAAAEVMRHVMVLIEGISSPDPVLLMQRAETASSRFTGDAPFYRWPDSGETFRRHYANVPWAPLVAAHADGSTTTSYFCNNVLHRDPAEGPAWQARTVHGEATMYMVRGKLHRDPASGPALRSQNFDGAGMVSEEYHVEGRLHRPSNLGPAVAVIDKNGNEIFAAYMENGKLHRDPSQGPALYDRLPQSGERVEYVVEGKLHRDPQEGPALFHANANGERTEYLVDDKLHRDPSDGPAVTVRSASGEIIQQEFWVDGELIVPPVPSTGNRATRRKTRSGTGKASQPRKRLAKRGARS